MTSEKVKCLVLLQAKKYLLFVINHKKISEMSYEIKKSDVAAGNTRPAPAERGCIARLALYTPAYSYIILYEPPE